MIKKLTNITIPVSNLKEAVNFYEKVLGLKKRYEWPTYVIFNCGIELAFEPGGTKGEKRNLPYIFLEVDDVDAEYHRLLDMGVKFKSRPKNEHWGGRTAGLTDPDGNKVVLVEYKEKYKERRK
ncbi:MAG: VOC family protein [candidate division WOR-3 bacterium]